MIQPITPVLDELDELLGDLFVATHGGKTAHDLPGNLDQHDYAQAKAALQTLIAEAEDRGERRGIAKNQLETINRMRKTLGESELTINEIVASNPDTDVGEATP